MSAIPLESFLSGNQSSNLITILSPDSVGMELSALGYGSTTFSTYNAVATLTYLYPIKINKSFTVAEVALLNGTTTAGNFDIGIYTVSGTTATRVASIGSATTQSGTSSWQLAALSASYTFVPGIYFIAICFSSASAGFYGLGLTTGQNAAIGMLSCSNTTIPLPSTLTVGGALASMPTNFPIYGLTQDASLA